MTALSFRQLSQEYVDDYPNYAYSPQAFPEFWTVINGRKTLGREEFEKSLLKYLNDTIRLLMEWRRPIVQVQRLNTLLYRGKHYLAQDMYSGLSLQKYRNRQFGRNATVVLNYLGQAADQYVAEMSAFEPNLAVRPKNDEESDRMAARMSKLALDHYFKLLNMKTSFLPFHLCTKIHGEAFKFVLWDPSLGDVHPRYKELRDMKMQRGEDPDISFPLVDPVTGNPILSDDNKPIIISRAEFGRPKNLSYDYILDRPSKIKLAIESTKYTVSYKFTNGKWFLDHSRTELVLNLRYRDWETDRKSTRLNSSHSGESRMPSSA